MPRGRRSKGSFSIKEMDLKEAQREFSRKRGRASKYDQILDLSEALAEEKALMVQSVSYSEVTGIRNGIREYLKGTYKIEATKVDKQKDLYDVLVTRKK